MTYIDENTKYVYSTDKRILHSVPSNVVHAVVPKFVEIIKGESSNLYAFKECNSIIETVSFEENTLLSEIQNYSFFKCYHLNNVDLSSCTHLTAIGSFAFQHCVSLTSIIFPQTLVKIGEYCFSNIGATSISLPSTLEELPYGLFESSSKLKTIDIPLTNNIKSLNGRIIASTNVSLFTITDKVISIDIRTFEFAYELETIVVAKGNTLFSVQNNALIQGTTLIKYPNKRPGDVVIPTGITIIGTLAFKESMITGVTIPNTVKGIGDWAFVGSFLKPIYIPDSVKTLNSACFYSISTLESVRFPSGIKQLANSLFKQCPKLVSIEIPDSVTVIGDSCFEGTGLTEVVLPDNLTSIGGNAFPPNAKLIFGNQSKFYVDDQYLVLDKGNTSISIYLGSTLTEIKILPTVKVIKAKTFYNRAELQKLKLDSYSELTTIEEYAFYGCTNLQFVTLPQKITSIGQFAFSKCNKLTEITLPNLVSMSISSFESCSKLNNIIFETSSVTTLRSRSFYSCQSLSSIKLPSTLVSIESECFAYCNQLSIVSFPQTLQTISNNAFINCNIVSADLSKCTKINILNDYVFHSNIDLSDFKFPPNINTIGVHSLSKTSISRINLPSRVQTINNYAFEECSNLDTIIIPEDSNLEFLGIGVFRYCFSISTINCTCPRYSIFGGALFNSDKTSLILFPPASRYSFFSLPDTTTTISQSAFQSCRNLVSVFIPSFSVRTISSNAFEGCTSLKSINIPLCVERVEQDAFLGCSSLECGLHIENRNKDFIHKLVNVSGLPSISIKQCISLYSCKVKLDKFSINTISPFIVIYIS